MSAPEHYFLSIHCFFIHIFQSIKTIWMIINSKWIKSNILRTLKTFSYMGNSLKIKQKFHINLKQRM